MPLMQITKYESGKSQYEEETGGDCVKFPTLRKHIARACLKYVSNTKHQRIKHHELDQTEPERLHILAEGNKRQQAFAEKRQVGGEHRQ